MKSRMQCFTVIVALLGCLALVALAQSRSKVRIGYCGPLKDIDAVKAAGFEYMEVRTSEVAALSSNWSILENGSHRKRDPETSPSRSNLCASRRATSSTTPPRRSHG